MSEKITVENWHNILRNTNEVDCIIEARKICIFNGFSKEFRKLMFSKGKTDSDISKILFDSNFKHYNKTKNNVLTSEIEIIRKEGNIRRRINSWSNGINDIGTSDEDREIVFHLCIALGVNLDEARSLIQANGIFKWVYPGNYKDLIYEYCIRTGKSLDEAYDLIEIISEKVNHYNLLDSELLKIKSTKAKTKILSNTKILKEDSEKYYSDPQKAKDKESFIRMMTETVANTRRDNSTLFYVAENALLHMNTLYKLWIKVLSNPKIGSTDYLHKNKEINFLQLATFMASLNGLRDGESHLHRTLLSINKKEKNVPRDIFIKSMILAGYYEEVDINSILRAADLAELNDKNFFDAIIIHGISKKIEPEKKYFAVVSEIAELSGKYMKEFEVE